MVPLIYNHFNQLSANPRDMERNMPADLQERGLESKDLSRKAKDAMLNFAGL